MKSWIAGIMLAGLVANLAGCVIVIGTDEDDGFHTVGEYDRINEENESAAGVLIDDLRERINADPGLRDEDLTLSVWKGRVTLSGRVSSAAKLERAIELLRADDRVDTVESKVSIIVRN